MTAYFDHHPKPCGEYDRVYSLGSDCRVKEAMRFNYLGGKRGPFDWLGCYSIEALVKILENKFKDFFLLENLIPHPDEKNPAYRDTLNCFHTRHELARTDLSLEEQYPEFRKKIDGIIAAFLADIQKVDRILFVFNLEFVIDPLYSFETVDDFKKWISPLHQALKKLCKNQRCDLQIVTFREELLEFATEDLFINIKPMDYFVEWMEGDEAAYWKDLLSQVTLKDPALAKGYDNLLFRHEIILLSEKRQRDAFKNFVQNQMLVKNQFDQVLQEQWKKSLKELGFVVIPQILGEDFVDEMLVDIQKHHLEMGISDNLGLKKSMHIWYKSRCSQALLSSGTLMNLLNSVTDSQLRLWCDQSEFNEASLGGQELTSQMSFFMPLQDPYRAFTISVALDSATQKNGTLYVIPSSHLWGKAQSFLQGLEQHDEMPPEYLGHTIQQEFVTVQKGDIVLLDKDLWHGFYANQSEHPRRAYLLKCFEDGALYKKPAYETGDGPFQDQEKVATFSTPLLGSNFIPFV
jgi:hypothetical protein